MTFALPGASGAYAVAAASPHPFIHQELIEVLYHTLWETVHVFFEHRELGHEVGQAGFLYPFLGREKQAPADLEGQVAESILMKAADDAALRATVAREQGAAIGEATLAMHARLQEGGKLIIFGNGGSATDANDFAIDCVAPPSCMRQVREV
jgi:D-sedoheptulose 7-phosphate isomerase